MTTCAGHMSTTAFPPDSIALAIDSGVLSEPLLHSRALQQYSRALIWNTKELIWNTLI